MKKKHIILELPGQDEDFNKIISDQNHQVIEIAFSSAALDGQIKHFVLVVWHDYEFGDHVF
ncbi:hypothetical protein ACFL35_19105 [Candidatus Riflebacteria bacterium]